MVYYFKSLHNMLNLRINIHILYMSCCEDPNINKLDKNNKVCINCLTQIPIIDNKSDDCCNNMNINRDGICISCGTIHQIFINELPFQENDAYQTNVLYKLKRVHNPYKYLKKNYFEINNEKVYDFIFKSIQFIQEYYKLKRKPFGKYVPYLYNFYRENNKNIPNLFKNNKNLILEKEIIDELNKLSNNKNISNIIKPKIDEKIIDEKYYYFNKSKNKYFKKLRYCSFDDCLKIGNFKDDSNKKYCKTHSNNGININNKLNFIKCKYNNCKKNTNLKYCQNHKFKCKICDNRIFKKNNYCSKHK